VWRKVELISNIPLLVSAGDTAGRAEPAVVSETSWKRDGAKGGRASLLKSFRAGTSCCPVARGALKGDASLRLGRRRWSVAWVNSEKGDALR
jgi:hypothetical protein